MTHEVINNVIETPKNIMPIGKQGFQRGLPRPLTAGRRKGTLNKFTTVKQAFLDFMEDEGGKDFIKKVASDAEGRRCVLNNIGRLLPKPVEISGPDGSDIKAKITVNLNIVKPKGE